MSLSLKLPPEGALVPNNDVDPLPFYYRPLTGPLFAARLNTGLRLLHRRFGRLCELGYGSGLLLPTLAGTCDQLWGVDREPSPPDLTRRLSALGVTPKALVQAEATALPFAAGFFDGLVAFSIFEHLRADALDRALAEAARVLVKGGQLLVGCPAVHKLMNIAFSAIGFADIDHHHFSSIADVDRAALPHFTRRRHATLPGALASLPLGWAPYTTILFERR